MTETEHTTHGPVFAVCHNPTPAARQNVERLTERVRNHPLAMNPSQLSQRVQSVGICGAGVMGAGIAAANVRQGIQVKMYDASSEALDRGMQAVRNDVESGLAASQNDSASDAHLPDSLKDCRSLMELAGCDLVIESVVENRELKQRILQQLAGAAHSNAILTTNTSTIPLGELATVLSTADRFCGLHFCNPVAHRPLVEIVRGSLTSDETISAAVAYAIRIGKLPIVVRDSPGFLVNRVLLPYLNEALEMVCQGADLMAMDRAAREFGMEMGPIELFDMIGTDTAMRAGRTLWEAFPDRTAITPVLPALVKRNRLGRKTGLGFYRYEPGQHLGQRDPGLDEILSPYIRRRREFTDQEITLRLILPMLVEATRLIEEKVVSDVRDVDVGLLFGLAFPSVRGGLLFWADTMGAKRILELMKPFRQLGQRMQPTALLQSMAACGTSFYDLEIDDSDFDERMARSRRRWETAS